MVIIPMTRRPPSSKRRRRRSLPPLVGFSPFLRSLSPSYASRASGLSTIPRSSKAAASLHLDSKTKPANHPRRQRGPRFEEQWPCSSDNEEEEEEEEEEEDVKIIQADFGFFDPKPGDFHGVKLLLQGYLDSKHWNLSEFVDLVLAQTTVGTVVKTDSGDQERSDGGVVDDDEEENIYSVISVLNLRRYAACSCIAQLKEYLLEVCDNGVAKKKMESLIEERASEVGLLVSQRFVNLQYQLVPHLYDSLFDEVSWATEDEPTQDLRDSFQLKYYLLLTRIFVRKNIANQKKPKNTGDSDDAVIYVKAEDDIFHEISMLSFTFGLKAARLAPPELRNYKEMGLVMVVNADKVPEFREKLKALVDDES